MSTGLNISPDDPHLGVDNRIRINEEIKTRVISVDDLPEEQRNEILDIQTPRGPNRIAPTGWFSKFSRYGDNARLNVSDQSKPASNNRN